MAGSFPGALPAPAVNSLELIEFECEPARIGGQAAISAADRAKSRFLEPKRRPLIWSRFAALTRLRDPETIGPPTSSTCVDSRAMARSQARQLVVCVSNEGYPASLEHTKHLLGAPDPSEIVGVAIQNAGPAKRQPHGN
jgi:hypothetical protein